MPQLNSLIESWRNSLSDLSGDQLDELEDHLRQEIAALQSRGLSEREAFTIAAMRCGNNSELICEYARDDAAIAWSARIRWMIIGCLACAAASTAFGALSSALGAVLVVWGASMPLSIALRTLLLVSLVASAGAACYVGFSRRRSPLTAQPPRWLTSAWTLAIAIVLVPALIDGIGLAGRLLLARQLSVDQMGKFALSGAVSGLVLPYGALLVLLMIAVALHRRAPSAERA